MKTIIVVISILLLQACATAPSQQEMIRADYGPTPEAENYTSVIAGYFNETLYDPSSLQITASKPPQKAWYNKPFTSAILYGYRICIKANAKNRFGGYVGPKWFYFLFHGEDLIAYDGGGYKYGTKGEERLLDLCK